MPRNKLSASGNIAATTFHKTLTSAEPLRFVFSDFESRVSARSRSLSDPAVEPDLHLTLWRSVGFDTDLPPSRAPGLPSHRVS